LKSKEVKTGCNLAESSKEGCGSERAVLPMMTTTMMEEEESSYLILCSGSSTEDRILLKGHSENRGTQWTQFWFECLGQPEIVTPSSIIHHKNMLS
jgi:hypothetical protein